MDQDERSGLPHTPDPEPPTARVSSVQWADEPLPTTAPPPASPRGWDWRWVLAFIAAGAIAFVGAMAIVTGGFRPVEVGPATPVSPAAVATPTPPPAPSPTPTSEPDNAVSTGPVGQQYGQYTNDRFGYTFIYPEDLLIPQGESADGASQQFISPDGQTLVAVGAAPNPTGMTLEEAYAEAQHSAGGRQVAHKEAGPTWYAVSGTQGTHSFYQKTYLTDDTFKTLSITYPRQYRAQYGQFVDDMATSFRPLD